MVTLDSSFPNGLGCGDARHEGTENGWVRELHLNLISRLLICFSYCGFAFGQVKGDYRYAV
jgi:hypothetical protein